MPAGRGLITRVLHQPSHKILALSLLAAVFLWGAGNAGTKHLMGTWPPAWTGGSRFFLAGLLLMAVVRHTNWLGKASSLRPGLELQLWLRGGLSLAVYIIVFNSALRYTAASHVALYLGASPVWALLWEGQTATTWDGFRRYLAAGLALAGVAILFWPSLSHSNPNWVGETLGLAASVLWTHYGRQCRVLGAQLSGPEVSAHSMWRAGLILLPLSGLELLRTSLVLRLDLLLTQAYCIVAGGVVAFAIWSNALRHWHTSQVLLFNNLIPLSTMTWAYLLLGEKVTSTFWLAMIFVVAGVLLGQANWEKLLPARTVPPE